MAVTKKRKSEILQQLEKLFNESEAFYFAKNLGLPVADSRNLRKKFYEAGNNFMVAKKTLIKIAVKNTKKAEVPDEVLDGAVGVAFSNQDPISAVKILADFTKKHDKIEIVGGFLENKFLLKSEAMEVSKIPSKEELLCKLLGSMISPLSGFVGVGNQVLGSFVRVLKGISEKKAEQST